MFQDFHASAKTIHDLFGANAFLIPAFQRPYAWDKELAERLACDILEGASNFLGGGRDFTFLGGIIVVEDVDLRTHYSSSIDQDVVMVVDGQQRITTSSILASALEFAIERELDNLKSASFTPTLKAHIQTQANTAKKSLRNLIATPMEDDAATAKFQYFPRIVRQKDDNWSFHTDQSYKSPIANFIYKFRNGDFGPKFEYAFPTETDPDQGKARIAAVAKALIRFINIAVREQNPNEFDLIGNEIDPKYCFENWERFSLIYGSKDEDLRTALKNDDLPKSAFSVILLTIYVRYFLRHCLVARVGAPNINYALAMFDALNTTGTPLTAVDILRASIVEFEGLAHTPETPGGLALKRVEKYLAYHDLGAAKQATASAKLLVALALSEEGHKLSEKLDQQRRWIQSYFNDTLLDASQKTKFINLLRTAATVMGLARLGWNEDTAPSGLSSHFSPKQLDELKLALEFLKRTDHTISLAIFIRYLDEFRGAEDDNSAKEAATEFLSIVKGVAAFWLFYRLAFGGTKSIETLIRKTIAVGRKKPGSKEVIVGPIARYTKHTTSYSENPLPSAESLKAAYRDILKQRAGIEDRGSFIKHVKSTAIGGYANIARFSLLAAFHQGGVDTSKPGLLTQDLSVDLLRYDVYIDDHTASLEHVAPDSKDRGIHWQDEKYSKLFSRNGEQTLGNLTLLPIDINSDLNDDKIELKQNVFNLFSCKNESDIDTVLSSIPKLKKKFSTKDIAERAPRMQFLRAISDKAISWDDEFVELRSENLAGRIWDNIASWLDY